jgi:hypothetical protein
LQGRAWCWSAQSRRIPHGGGRGGGQGELTERRPKPEEVGHILKPGEEGHRLKPEEAVRIAWAVVAVVRELLREVEEAQQTLVAEGEPPRTAPRIHMLFSLLMS